MPSRRQFLIASAAGAALVATRRSLFAEAPLPVVTVYKEASCACCAKWVKHLSANGFVTMVHDVPSVDEVKRTMGVPAALQSCHTAVAGRYVIEGHVPADLIKKLIAERSTVRGLAVPGMVDGSPGMEGARREHYDVIAFQANGAQQVYAHR
jgi:hypothetical protein